MTALLRWNLAYLATVVLHDLDHVRQGRALGGWVQGIGFLSLAATITVIVLTVSRSRVAPAASALVGFAGALGLVAVHVIPHWSAFSDAYPQVGVDALSWLALAPTFLAGLGMGLAGLRNKQAAAVSAA